MEDNGVEDTSRKKRRRAVLGAVLGWLGVAFALWTCKQVVAISLDLWKIPPDTSLHLMVPLAAVTGAGIFTVVVCGTLGVLCVWLQAGRLGAWIIAAIGLAIALAVTPLGRWALHYVISAHRPVDSG